MNNQTNKKIFAELLGTFILASAIEFNTIYFEGTQKSNTFCILAGFFIAITITREISGGHINPAVTFTFYISEQDQNNKNNQYSILFPYMISQCIGALCAALLGIVFYNGNIFKIGPNPSSSLLDASILEMIGSAFFYATILVQTNKNAYAKTDKTLSTLMITGGLACGSALAGNVSGAGLNPAIGFGFNFARLLVTGNIEECRCLWIYIISPLAGSYIASYFYNEIFQKYFLSEEDNKEINLYSIQQKKQNNDQIGNSLLINKQAEKIEMKEI